MYDFAGKPFESMTIAELRAYLAQPEITPHVKSKYNSKTRRGELEEIASAAHRSFHDSGDADRTRVAEFATDGESVADYVRDMPAEPAQGLNADRTERAKLEILSHPAAPAPMHPVTRVLNYKAQNNGGQMTPKQRRRATKKARKFAATQARLSGGYGITERV